MWSDIRFTMRPLVVRLDQKGAQARIELWQRQTGLPGAEPGGVYPGWWHRKTWFTVSKMRSTLPHPRGYLAN